MNVRTLIRNPLIAAVVGAAVVGVPLTALYGGLGDALAAPASAPAITAPAPVTAAPSTGVVLPDFSSMVQKYGPAVVNITVTGKQPAAAEQGDDEDSDGGSGGSGGSGGFDPFGPNSPFAPFFRGMPHARPQQPMHGEGSGFIIRPDGLILTNAHVVNDASEVTVRLVDRREYTAKVIGSDTKSDVAVIRINAKDLPTVRLGDSHNLKVGEWVLAIGAPFGLDNTATAGIVSAKGRVLEGYVPFIQTDVPINPGNSGGPLFNLNGEVVGINSQIYSQTGGYMGVSFSIPIDVAMQISKQLETTGHVVRGQLGVHIQPVTQGFADSFGLSRPEGALVAQIEPNSAAARAGIKSGDVILKLNGQTVKTSDELPAEIAGMAPGTTVNLEVWREHALHNVSVTLGQDAPRMLASREQPGPTGGKLGQFLGSVRPLSPTERRQSHITGGLVVEEVSAKAADVGIRPGDVVLMANDTPVATTEDLRGVVEKSKGYVALLVQRGNTQIFFPMRVG